MLHTLLVFPDGTHGRWVQVLVLAAHKLAVESGHKGATSKVGVFTARLQQTYIAHGIACSRIIDFVSFLYDFMNLSKTYQLVL